MKKLGLHRRRAKSLELKEESVSGGGGGGGGLGLERRSLKGKVPVSPDMAFL